MRRLRFAAGFSVALAGFLACPCSQAVAEASPQEPGSQTSVEVALAAMPPEQRGDLLMARGEFLAAIDAYKEASPSAQVLNKEGMAYHHLLAIDLAKKDYEKALLIRPNYPEAINNLGAAYFAQRNYRKAIRLYKRAMQLMPRSAVIAANLGTAYFARAEYREGLQAYRIAFTLDPDVFGVDNPGIIAGPTRMIDRARQDYCIAELFAQAGMQDRAIEYLRKAIGEGFRDRQKLMEDAVFAQLRQSAEFARLMSEEKIH